MSDSPEYKVAPPRSISEFSVNSYRSVYHSMQKDADALAMNVISGEISYVDAVKPLVIGESYIGSKMENDPEVSGWDRKIWGQLLPSGKPDAAVANKVVEEVLEYSGQTDKVENLEERTELLRKLEADLIDEAQHTWRINPATRQDTFFRLQFMREVIDRATREEDKSGELSTSVVKARAVAQNLRYMQAELSQFLAAKKPSLKSGA